MSLKIEEKSDCCGCMACMNACPVSCISMEVDKEGFWYPRIDEEKCIHCNLCEAVCPISNNAISSKEISVDEVKAYACINLAQEIREASSSGGVFSLLAEEVIKDSGKVYGAAFDEEGLVCHIGVENEEELSKLRGSKYLQSRIDECYLKIKEELEKGRKVLFSGTPCQNAGLRTFLRKDYENLYCVDFICHGVPSPSVWKKYLNYLEKYMGLPRDRESNPSFRSKKDGWIRFSISIPFSNGIEYRENLNNDLYMQTFLKDISLRPSCYECQFKPSNNISDITIADFWGIQHVLPEMFDNKGTSLVFVNSKKGEKLLKAVSEKMKWKEVDYNKAIEYNPSAYRSVKRPKRREKFFKNINCMDIEVLMKKVTKDSFYLKAKRKVISIVKKILSYDS